MPNTADLGILFLHALPLDGSMWASQMDILPGRTHAPTLYSFGATLEEWATKALAGTRHDRLIIIGCSVGGSCALEVAQLAPNRVAALVLIGTKPKHRPDPALRDRALEMIATNGVAAAWDEYWEPLFSASSDRTIIDAAKTTTLRHPASDIATGVAVFHSRKSSDRFAAECTIPITVVTGEEDLAPGVEVSKNVAGSAQTGSLHVVPRCGHYVSLEQPEALREILCEVVAAHA
jgi:pimeloyl-ACP methyl ester carboxylesterase